ncbi:phosphatase PAP2 family protein [Corynebacterium sp. sy039]|uniref:phosphatase PAP2 family protein n=1 Tax=Corynebacterium sp. sy039 TaxID=2599641 RepID=UPI0011B76833|nr:phosphatase PAP2 family protein [Corynebacterium sp. sy039]QDZ41938.1 phosphatase PAP2 family protein [Corynebacterium sp. sy039]
MAKQQLEADILVEIQKRCVDKPGALQIARGMSHFGEHALGWMGIGALGALIDRKRRAPWLKVIASAFISHAASVVIKRIVRRKRPHDSRIKIGVATPSKLSFPSSHATSTTAALVSISLLAKSSLPLIGVPAMMLSRMVLGVHYPTDVLAGAALGAVTATSVERLGRGK